MSNLLGKITIRGKVIDSVTKLPISTAVFSGPEGFGQFTDSKGEFMLPNILVKDSSYDLNFHRNGYQDKNMTVTFVLGDNDLGTIELTPEGVPSITEYPCPHCPFIGFTKGQLSGHIQAMHPGLDMGLNCQVCGDPFRTVLELTQHMLTHIILPAFVCPDCKTEVNFCSHCGKRFEKPK